MTAQFVETHLAGKDGADDQFRAIIGTEETPGFGEIAVNGAWGQGKRSGNLFVRISPPHDAVARAGMEPW